MHGPIGVDALADYGIACALELKGATNKSTVSCKVCGATVAPSAGLRATLMDPSRRRGDPAPVYLCQGCGDRVSAAVARYQASRPRDTESPAR